MNDRFVYDWEALRESLPTDIFMSIRDNVREKYNDWQHRKTEFWDWRLA